ncbi:hypothetical protein RclHR1_07910014 [Rhizophagus clarus]|uniref:Uncharacterized protein n=1 Tax=Rhizophagus clarus TaxID=94130 RepID=A0A2Z6SAF6_9GLOM|nr:hypothetical protein RclHR1_07910014 [Rhizophagus clarus]
MYKYNAKLFVNNEYVRICDLNSNRVALSFNQRLLTIKKKMSIQRENLVDVKVNQKVTCVNLSALRIPQLRVQVIRRVERNPASIEI